MSNTFKKPLTSPPKVMKLNPSQKPKKRYVVFEIKASSKPSFTDKELFESIESNLDRFFGIWGRALSTPMLLKETLASNKETNTKLRANEGLEISKKFQKQVIIKIGHKFTDELKVAMALLTQIKTKTTQIKVSTTSITTSGTIKSAKEKMAK